LKFREIDMKKFAAILGAALAMCAYAAPAQAQATRTFVSGVGNDADPCSRTAPCRTFAGAIVKTFINGEINCLDPGGYGTVNITKSITIDCGNTVGSILASGTTGVIVNIGVSVNDPQRTVRLRGIMINGTGASGAVGTRTGINGIRIDAATAVFVEDSLIEGFTQRGILDRRTTGGELYVTNTTVRNMTGAGIITFPTSGSTRIDASINNVRVQNVQAGFAAINGGKMMIANSVVSGSSIGIDSEGAGTEIFGDHVSISGNATGLFTASSGVIRLSNSNVAYNTTGVSGTVNSFSNNRFVSNGAGGVISAIAPAGTNPSGQQ
jgi:hypothetical protein